MADKKISQLTELTAPVATDYLPVIDVSETANADKNKRVTYNTLLTNIPEGSASTPSIRWIGDPDTGLAKSGNDGIMMVTGGTARLSIASNGKVTIANDLQVNGTTTTIDSTTLTVKDKNIEIAKGNGNDAAVDGAGITIDSTDGDKTWNWVDSTDAWTSSEHIDLASGKVLKVAGTQVLSATAFTGNAATATTATNVTLAAESTDTSCSILFATAATGNLPPKTATSLTFNSNTGALTATSFVGNLTGNVTGNTSGTSGGLTGTPNITVGDVVAASLDISGNVDIDGTLETDALTIDGATLSETIADTVGAMVSSNTETGVTVTYEDSDNTLDFVIGTLNQNTTGTAGGLTGTPNITVGDVVAASLDISGNADIDGTLEADALTIDGTALNEYIADTIGAMVGSNTETGITVTYEDSDNTLDFVIGTLNQNTTGNAATATEATNVTVSANNSTDETVYPVFVDGATGTQGAETDTGLTYNPSTGVLTSTSFTGSLTGNASGSSGSCTGNAATATALATARNINGVAFDGSAAITVTAAAGTLTGTELKSTVVTSSLTSVGTLTSLTSGAITTTDNMSVDNAKEVRMYEADSNGSAYVGIKGATDKGSDASYTISLPSAAPTANQILKADSSTPTNLTWATDSGGIPDTGGTFTGKVTHNYTSSLRIPVGTTGQRDGSPSDGDFRFNSSTSKFEGYNSGWGEIGGGATGTADLLDIASSSGTGGGGATFDGNRYRFKLVTKGTSTAVTPTNAEILRVSINGVIQKPNDGTGQGDMTEGYVVDGTDIIFDSAPASGSDYFIINMGTTIAVGTPGDQTVTEAKLNANAPTTVSVLTADSSSAGGFKWAEAAGCGATGGSGEKIFLECENEMNNSYTITANHNAGVFGPLTIAAGTITVNSPSVLTII